jgi:hypothetical protein
LILLLSHLNYFNKGISSDNLKMIKEGVQFDANKLQAGGGSGLGLWITKG